MDLSPSISSYARLLAASLASFILPALRAVTRDMRQSKLAFGGNLGEASGHILNTVVVQNACEGRWFISQSRVLW